MRGESQFGEGRSVSLTGGNGFVSLCEEENCLPITLGKLRKSSKGIFDSPGEGKCSESLCGEENDFSCFFPSLLTI